MSADFAHLHVHTEYSVLDGACKINDAMTAVRTMGMDSLAITDHGVMYGAVEFYKSALKHGIRPIIGSEIYVAQASRKRREGALDSQPNHLVLLAMNTQGYINLMRIVTRGFTEGFYYKPRVDHEVLREYSSGLIALSACLKGELQQHLLHDDLKAANDAIDAHLSIFGEENYFIELMDHGMPEQHKVNPMLVEIARTRGVGLVATNDSHYVRREDSDAHDHLLCIQTGSSIADPKRMRFSSDEFYLKSPAEMAALFPDYPEALSNTVEIASRCNVEIELNRYYLPDYQVPEGYSLNTYLRELTVKGMKSRYGDPVPEDAKKRLDYELRVIDSLGFCGYFLIVWDFINYARQKGIKVGPGRGSAAGSIVAYALGITAIEPLRYNLLFERFLNAERNNLPDIDIDLSHYRRAEVIEYVSEKYGRDRVSPIITFSRLKAKQAVKDVGRVNDVPYAEMEALTKLVPDEIDITIEQALLQSVELKEKYDTDENIRKIIDTAKKIEGLIRQPSVHAAGIVIAPDAIDTYAPLSLQQKSGDDGNLVTTQYDMSIVEELGLLKVDMLGLKTQSLLELAVNLVEDRQGIKLDIDTLPMDDEETFRLIQSAQTIGTFQLASSGMRSLMIEMQPTSFEDIIALIALFRPGPLDSGMHTSYVEGKHGRKEIVYPHPSTEEILNETYGVIVYQEQAMQIAQAMAGFTGNEADELRKAIAKKKTDLMETQKAKFLTGSAERGVDSAVAKRVFELIETFGGYGFNKSHSTAYALISYQTAYLKAHYPSEFMAANMTIYMDNPDRLVEYIEESKRMDIDVRLPDINQSASHFTPAGDHILFGLSAIRNVGSAVVGQIMECRDADGPFSSLQDFCLRVPPQATNRKTLESLIKSGAFDSLEPDRGKLLGNFEAIVAHAQRKRKEKEEGQYSLFGDEDGADEELELLANGAMIDHSEREILAMEKEMLGVYVSDHPLREFREALLSHVSLQISEITARDGKRSTKIGGLISRVEKRFNRQGKPWARVTVEDFTGSIEVLVFHHKYEKLCSLLVEDTIVLVGGRLELEEKTAKIIADNIMPLPTTTTRKPEVITLKVDTRRFSEQLVSDIKNTLLEHSGDIPVRASLCESGTEITQVKFGDLYSVSFNSELIDRLHSLLGEKAVLFNYPRV